MDRRLLRRLVLPLGLVALLSACTIRLADLNAISTRNVKLDRIDLDKLPGKHVEGTSSGFWFLFIPLSFPNLQDAVDNALDEGRGDLLTDAVIYGSAWWFLIGEQTVTVKGTAVSTRGSATEGK